LNESEVTTFGGVQRRAAYGGQGHWAGQQDVEYVLFPAGPLKVSRQS
jgi:hypothetical protein